LKNNPVFTTAILTSV